MPKLNRYHFMPFGARILEDGRVNFRLWAPGAEQVQLCLQGRAPELRLHMVSEPEGWFGITTDLAGSGFYYQYLIDGKHYVSDPASRYQPVDVNGSSQVIDPGAWHWEDDAWKGKSWNEVVFYQLHVGTFTEEGTFKGLKKRLDYLADLGVTAIQLMPIADFSGCRNWGYDAVLPFAPDSSYGTPDDLKDLIATAHGKGLMVFNDVVYNHFGPEGNYLHLYAPAFFTYRVHTPWGDAVNFDGPHSYWVRQFFIHNALYWLEEYHFDGLRFDAVHAIYDETSPDVLEELAEAVRMGPGYGRPIYLVLENDNNAAHYLRRNPLNPDRYFNAQWNDDIHHAFHVLLTGETNGYYQDYKQQPLEHLGRCLTEGFAYQGERSAYRDGKSRGEASVDLPLTSFVNFLQNHDQVGNRAYGERISSHCAFEALRAATAILLLMPSPPLLFMGQEWVCSQPFTYFVDFPDELGEKVNMGRLLEFARFPDLIDVENRQKMPLPNAAETYRSAKLTWDEIDQSPHRQWIEYHRELLNIRRRHICPRIKNMAAGQARYRLLGDSALSVQWCLNDDSALMLVANLGDEPVKVDSFIIGEVIFATDTAMEKNIQERMLMPWSVILYFGEQHGRADKLAPSAA